MQVPTTATRSIPCRANGCPYPARYWATTQFQNEHSGEWGPANHMAWCPACTYRMADLLTVRMNSEGWLTFKVEPIEGLEYTFRAIARMTEAQRETVDRLFTDWRATSAYIGTRFDLPPGYIDITLNYYVNRSRWAKALFGGIGPEGDAHT